MLGNSCVLERGFQDANAGQYLCSWAGFSRRKCWAIVVLLSGVFRTQIWAILVFLSGVFKTQMLGKTCVLEGVGVQDANAGQYLCS